MGSNFNKMTNPTIAIEQWRSSKGMDMLGESDQDTCQKGVTLI